MLCVVSVWNVTGIIVVITPCGNAVWLSDVGGGVGGKIGGYAIAIGAVKRFLPLKSLTP